VYSGTAAGDSSANVLEDINKDTDTKGTANNELFKNRRMFTTYKNYLTK
jgi:hypothetical protein